MNNILDKIKDSTKYVSSNSKYVKINYDNLDQIIDNLDTSKINFWLQDNPFNILDLKCDELVNFLLIFHTIGDYCFWGEPKWSIETTDVLLDGSYAIMYLIIKRFKEGKSFNMTYDEFSDFLKGNVEIPLLDDRYNNLVTMNNFLKEHGSFYNLIKDMSSDIELLNYIINNFDYFNDEAIYKDRKIYFYKRAQLLTSDILHVRNILEGKKFDYSHLRGCADYKIPQVMRCFNILEFNHELADLVDNKKELTENSEMEVEIRANDLVVLDYMYKRLNKQIPIMDLNDYLWSLGQDKKKMTKPYHRTLTKHY